MDISEPLAAMQSTQKQLRTALDRIGKQIEKIQHSSQPLKTIFQGQLHPKKLRKIPILEQSIEITVEDGVTKTQLFPSNEKLIEEGQAMDPPPEMVYRRMNFVNGIPPEYHWATTDEDRRQRGGAGIQRMMIDTWLDVIDAEKADPSGHIGPCGGNLPRPKRADGRLRCEGTDDSVPNRESAYNPAASSGRSCPSPLHQRRQSCPSPTYCFPSRDREGAVILPLSEPRP